MVAVTMLEKAGFAVDAVANGAEAVEAVATRWYDAVLMDCQMPGMDGYQAAATIRASAPGGRHVPIIALTASARREDLDRCLEMGMDDHLSKPFKRDQLIALVTRWSAGDGAEPGTGAGASTEWVDRQERLDEETLADLGPDAGPLLDLFLAETSKRITRLRRALLAADLDDAGRAAHSIKGSAGIFGARRLSGFAAEIEAGCRSGGGMEHLVAVAATMEPELRAFRAELSTLVDVGAASA
jgi:CheY-like chemotaxis protein/HPt (histidine-containing phosphotransfer) domain-containing protein